MSTTIQPVSASEEQITEAHEARNLYDFTISAPKAISVQALEDPRLIAAKMALVIRDTPRIRSLRGTTMTQAAHSIRIFTRIWLPQISPTTALRRAGKH